MDTLLGFAGNVAMGFFAIMNPIGNTPVFLGLVSDLDAAARRRVALRSVALAFAIVAAFAVGGQLLFRAFGITLHAFRIAGGLLVFIVGYQLLHARPSAVHHPGAEDGDAGTDETDVAVTPLAVPILAGPGTITTAMSFVGPHLGLPRSAVLGIVLGVFAATCLATYACFVWGQRMVARLGSGIIKVVTRLMGLLLTIIAVQMVIEGVAGTVRAYLSR